jgi:DNA-binding Lrp family transcriptional regulator
MMDNIDREIIRILEENSRTSFRKIARILNVSPMTVVKRVRRLEKACIIKKYTIQLDYDKLGYICNLCILIRVKPGYDIVSIGRKIAEMPETLVVNQIAGDYDLSVIAKCRGKDELGRYIQRISGIEGVERVNSYFVIQTICSK